MKLIIRKEVANGAIHSIASCRTCGGRMNLNVYHMIIAPKELDELFEGIPQKKKDWILDRDCK